MIFITLLLWINRALIRKSEQKSLPFSEQTLKNYMNVKLFKAFF